ncbi:MAG TPA: long-chain fatty acid--CoA ligase, partial [Candidatus Acidoferrales bacterium]|nr:long-chain fatty acid--CoA ligase [Candidatus Acidoferrales bacterium]
MFDSMKSPDGMMPGWTAESERVAFERLPNRIMDILRTGANKWGDRLALVEGTGRWTYGELKDAVDGSQDWLRNSGVRPGDRVMLVAENCRAFVALMFAVSALDAWPVPVNARLSAREIGEIRDHSGARRIFYTVAASPHAKQHAEQSQLEVADVSPLGPIGIGRLNEDTKPERIESDGTKQVALLLYTSGTTGRPKGVMLTHRNVLFSAATASTIRSLTPDDRLYGVLPMSHVVGCSAVLLSAIYSGASVFLSPRFDPVTAQGDIEKHGLTVFLGVPSMYALLVEYAKLRRASSFKLPSLRIISCSGAPLGPGLKSDVERLFGLSLCNGYGLSETSPSLAQVHPDFP